MRTSPAKVTSRLKQAAYGNARLVYWINVHSTEISTVVRHVADAASSATREARVAEGGLDMESWAKFLKLGDKFAKALCAGDVKEGSYGGVYKVSVRVAGKTYARSNTKLIRGTIYNEPVVSDGYIAFPCANPPPFAESYSAQTESIARDAMQFNEEVQIAFVPDFDSWKDNDDASLIVLSDDAGVNAVLLGAVVASVGSPFTLRHATPFLRYEEGKQVKDYIRPILVTGPNGTGLVMPVRREKHA